MAEGYREVLASVKQRPPEKDALLSLGCFQFGMLTCLGAI